MVESPASHTLTAAAAVFATAVPAAHLAPDDAAAVPVPTTRGAVSSKAMATTALRALFFTTDVPPHRIRAGRGPRRRPPRRRGIAGALSRPARRRARRR